MIYYRVKDWSEHYENNRTRDMVKMAWVPVPNKHDGEGYKRVMREPDGIIIYGCWHLILQVASKCLRERGTLLRDDGTAIDAEALALKTGWNTPADFERTLAFLSSTQVGWLERVATSGEQIPQEGAGIPQEGARKGRELKGIEGKELSAEPTSGATVKLKSFKQWTEDEFKQSIIKANHDRFVTSAQMVNFFDYWTEPTASGRFRFAMEKTWDTRKRLKRALNIGVLDSKLEPTKVDSGAHNLITNAGGAR